VVSLMARVTGRDVAGQCGEILSLLEPDHSNLEMGPALGEWFGFGEEREAIVGEPLRLRA
jgi:hypothetical protein